MSAINESLRKLEERGAMAQAVLPPGVVASPLKKSAKTPNHRLLYLALLLTVIWSLWSEWDRRHPVPNAQVIAPVPVQVKSQPAPNIVEAKVVPVGTSGAEQKSKIQPKQQATTPAPRNVAAAPPTAAALVQAPAMSGPVAMVTQPAAPAKKLSATTGDAVKTVTSGQKADIAYSQALQLLQEGRGTDARQRLEDALELNPAQGEVRQLLAALTLEDRQLGRAEALLTDGLLYQPGPAALVSLARLKVERGEDAAALKLLTEYQEVGNNDAEYRAFMATLLVRVGRPAEAIAHYRAAIERQPARGIWWAGLGLALATQKDRTAETAQALQQARLSGKLPSALADKVDSKLLELLRQEGKP